MKAFLSRVLRRCGFVVTATSLATMGLLAVSAQVAHADSAPDPGTPATVTADALPTWQINGVVWSEVTVGNTVYATGSFSAARPPGVVRRPSVGGQRMRGAKKLIFSGANALISGLATTPANWPLRALIRLLK